MENNDITHRQFWDRNKTTMDMSKENNTFCEEIQQKVLNRMKEELDKRDMWEYNMLLKDSIQRAAFQRGEKVSFTGFYDYITPNPRDNRRSQERCSKKRLHDRSYPPKPNTYGSK